MIKLRTEAAGIASPLSPASNVNILEYAKEGYSFPECGSTKEGLFGFGDNRVAVKLPQEEGERGGQQREELELIHQVIVERHVMRMGDRRKKHSHQPEHHCVGATAK